VRRHPDTREETTVKRILIPLDGSRLSETVLPLGEALARDLEADLLLVRALRPLPTAEAESVAQEEAERYLTGTAAALRERGRAVEWKLWFDDAPDRAIADAARQSGVDLIVMSTHGRGGLTRLLFGSVAESLVRQSPVPVFLVRGDLTWVPGGIARILVPLDGSRTSEGVIPAVEALAGPFDVAVDLLQVVEPIPTPGMVEVPVAAREQVDVQRTEAARYLETLAARLEAKGLRVRSEVRDGPAVETIALVAQETGAGLIAMATHGRSGLERLLVGSVAERVMRAAPAPVLLWRERPRA
jgi:nucleotide-binding universal stress UspA family protein